MAVVARLGDEASGTRRTGMCWIILEEGSAVANGARGLLAGTIFFNLVLAGMMDVVLMVEGRCEDRPGFAQLPLRV